MKSVIQRTATLAMVAVFASAQPARVHPLTGSRRSLSGTAATKLGETYLGVRELRVDLDFPTGGSGKAVLLILFDPVSGLYDRSFQWSANEYPEVLRAGGLPSYWRVGLNAGRLTVVAFLNPELAITESTEQAVSLDQAEMTSLQWISDHLLEVEARTIRPVAFSGKLAYPPGFFSPGPQISATSVLPVEFLAMAAHNGGWDLTLRNTENQKQVTVLATEHGTFWSFGLGRIEDNPARR